ncbi:2-C-methyl-D-erythritol 4-phosphate cytidylyltransferase [Thomasclavelia spiroformis]|uniref:2-C-methyl-D-erythritol 4-phosphate cytidylyltransferase n=1 Tax=Thomasclavelia spiroformis TaxID=29348 RepID=A0A921GCV0_9FIRM|nr:2-C-methyl-D-erythritol 4-phosphate cytidylyltransferase [Thomasclavelia spiroformis]HJF40184.1 2-C-methyl-D-erythritol 4-phosphate cytidylyltransferase [Thomasclavelia spiroformis]
MNYSAIVLCAGKGSRSGLTYNKMLYCFKNKTVYEMTMEIFLNDERCKQIVVVTKEEELDDLKKLISSKKIDYVFGGKERQDSVYNGLQVVKEDYVLIHDGARPYLKKENIDDILECLNKNDACLLVVPVKDTIKVCIDGNIVKTLPREQLVQAQTPQAFKTELIKRCYQKGKDKNYIATDDASLVEYFENIEVKAVLGSYSNIKITTPDDL